MAERPVHSRREKVTLTTIVRLDSHMLRSLTSDKAIVLHIHQAIELESSLAQSQNWRYCCPRNLKFELSTYAYYTNFTWIKS